MRSRILFKDWATIFIENGISNPKEIMNSVNKPSIWAAYCIFCLAWGFSEMLAVPLKQTTKKNPA